MANKDMGELYETRFGFKERKKSFVFLAVLLTVALALIILCLYFFTAFTGVVVKGNSMKNTLFDGDKLFVKKIDGDEANYGDIIVVDIGKYLTSEEKEEIQDGLIIKRLIAKEGDRVMCRAGVVSVWYKGASSWTALDEEYAYYGVDDFYKDDYEFEEYEVGEGEIFFLGDNRSSKKSSSDSRYKEGCSHIDGLYKQTDIIGLVTEWSLDNRALAELLIKGKN